MNESPPEPMLYEFVVTFTVEQTLMAPSMDTARELADIRNGEIVDVSVDYT